METGHHHQVNDEWEEEIVISLITITKSYIGILLNDERKLKLASSFLRD